MSDKVLMTYVTCPERETAKNIASTLVDEHLAACVNIVSGLESVYRWQGAVEIDDEFLLLIKTTERRLEDVKTRVMALHPDELPEIVAVPIEAGLDAYLSWVREETAPQ